MRRYAFAVIVTVEASDENSAYERITDAIGNALHDTGISDEFATGGFPVPADHSTDETYWSIPSIRWHSIDLERDQTDSESETNQ